MAFNLSKTLSTAAATGLVLGAITACGGNKPPPETPAPVGTSVDSAAPPAPADSATPGASSDSGAAAPEAKACCKAKNDCKGKGGCKSSDNGCAGKNSCRGRGGCNANCPK